MLLDGLVQLKSEYSKIIGDVRGRGLFVGIEFVKDVESITPYPEACRWVVQRARTLGVLLSVDGPFYNVIKMKPPIVISMDAIMLVLSVLQRCISEFVSNLITA